MKKDNRRRRFGNKRKMKRDTVLFIDLEATCWRGRPPVGMVQEIIEIGISGIDYRTKEIRFKDTILVKPEFSEVSEFCTELTSITQDMLDADGVTFAEACKILEEKFKSRDRIWMSWGSYDKNQLKKDCELKNVSYPFERSYFDLCPLFSFAYGLPSDMGVSGALDYLGLNFDGTAHRGIDDAYNIARIAQKVFINSNLLGKHIKKEHQLLSEHLESKYNEEDLKANVAKVINKTTPTNQR